MTTNREDLYGKALDHLEKWELDEAEETLRRLLEEEPEHARAVNKLGVVYARRQDLRQAEMCFNDAIALDPQLASAHSNLGNIYAEQGWYDRAKECYERALALDPGNPTATHNLGVLYRKSGDIAKGVSLLKQANRPERYRMRSEIQSSPESRRVVRVGWIVIAVIAVVVLYLLNR